MREEIELNGRQYSVIYSTDTLLPENRKYVDHVEATIETPKGTCRVTSARILNRIHEKLESML